MASYEWAYPMTDDYAVEHYMADHIGHEITTDNDDAAAEIDGQYLRQMASVTGSGVAGDANEMMSDILCCERGIQGDEWQAALQDGDHDAAAAIFRTCVREWFKWKVAAQVRLDSDIVLRVLP